MKIADVIRGISVDLNDQEPGNEYTRWTVSQLQTYLQEALVDVGTKLRDLFVEKVVVKLAPGSGWQVACDCTTILRVIGETDAAGNVIRTLRRSQDLEENIWPGSVQNTCANPRAYVMTGYTVSAFDDREFRVTPPVPPGVTKYILIECYRRPSGADLNEAVPDEAVAIIKQWVLYRALSVDSENNPTVLEIAAMCEKTYFNLLRAALLTRELEKANGQDSNSVRAVQKPSSD